MSIDVEKIKIAIDVGELQKAKDMLDKLEGQAKKTDKSVSGLSTSFFDLKSAIAGVSAYQLAANFVKTADAMNLLDGRLKLATKSTEEYLSQQTKLTAIAKGTYTSISDTVTLFTKLNPALTKVGATTDQVNSIVATFQRGLQLGGASARESSSAILQFAQAMGSGVLRGEEFNAMAEASPKLMEYLAKGLGVPQTALRKMAEEGQLTASKVGNALLKVKNDIEKDFLTMPVTVSKAMTNLQTDLMLSVREIDKTTGATQLLSDEIVKFSGNIDGYTKAVVNFYTETKKYINEHNEGISTTTELVKTGVEAYLGYRVISSVMEKGATAIAGLRTAMTVFNPIVGAVALAGTALFNTWIEGKTRADNLGKSVDELAKSMQKLDIQSRLSDVNKELAEMDKRFAGYSDTQKLMYQGAYDTAYKEKQKLEGALDAIDNKKKSIKELFSKIDTDGLIKSQTIEFKDFSSELQKAIDPIRQVKEHFATLRQTLTEGGGATPQALANLAKAEAEAIDSVNKKANKSAEDLKKKQEEISKAYEDIAKEGMTDYDKKLYEIAIKTKDFIALTGDVTTGLDQQTKATTKLNEEEAKKNIEKRNTAIDKELKSTKDLFDLKEKQLGLIDDENIKNQELSVLYNARQKKEIQALYDKGEISKDYYDSSMKFEDELLAKNLMRYSQTGQIIESVSSGMKSSMMDFFDYTSAGFGDLKKMALDLGNMIYKAVTQQMVVNPLVNAIGAAANAYFAPTATAGSATASNNAALGIQGADSNMSAGLPFAKGGAFNGSSSLSQYSNSVVDKPTFFAFAKGGAPNLGVMGEAGSEAIMPLTRDSSGSLGVKAVGGNGVVKVEVINQSNQEVQVTNTSTRNDLEGTVLSIVINGIQNNRMGLRTALGR